MFYIGGGKVETNGATCTKMGSHTPRGGTFLGPYKFPGARGSVCDVEGPE
jgi:hypothetical protein